MGKNPTLKSIKHDVISALTDEWQTIEQIAANAKETVKVTGLILTGLTFQGGADWRPTKPALYRKPQRLDDSPEGSHVSARVTIKPPTRNEGRWRNP